MLKKNDLLTLEIESLNNLGFGVARHEGMVIFVQDTVPGDAVEAKIIKLASSYCVARLVRIVTPSELRGKPRCKNTRCRGCAYKNVSYENELIFKREDIKYAFIKAGLPGVDVLPINPSPRELGYRNKAQYPVRQTKDGEYVIGFFAPKSHTVSEAADCPLSHPDFTAVLETLRALFKKYRIPAYAEESGSGVIRHIYMRRSEMNGRVLLTLVINRDTLPHSDEICKEVCEAHPFVSGVMLNVNTKNTNVILGERWQLLSGEDYIVDTLGGVQLKITAPSFYQVNRDVADAIYRRARELASLTSRDTLLDLFCGTGSIGLSMANDVRELIGIEIVGQAIECARENAKINGITNARFFVGDATDTRLLLRHAEEELKRKITPTVVILDPPRAGCDSELVRYVAELCPLRIVYISCNPQTLARDVKLFSELGYQTSLAEGWDMFPLTGHVETIVCLSK